MQHAKRYWRLGIILPLLAGEKELVTEARLTASTTHRALNQPAQARQAFEEAIATIETLRT